MAFRDSRVIADPLVEGVLAIYAGSTADKRYHTANNLGQVADVRYSPRDNLVSPDWPGEMALSQHQRQDHAGLLERNPAQIAGFLID